MPSLADSQHAFAEALMDPAAPAPGDIHRPADQAGTRRFDVYRNNVAVSLIEALASTYPAVDKLVGDTFFRAAAKAYIAVSPPASPILLGYGEAFGDFLDGFEPAAGVPYLGDVARLEYARLAAYHAADADPTTIEELGTLAPEQMQRATVTFHPSAHLVRSRFPVVSLWAATTGSGDDVPVDMNRGEDALVVRPGLEVDCRILPVGGGDFIERLMAGDTLRAAAEYATSRHPDFTLPIHIAGLFETGAVVAIIAG